MVTWRCQEYLTHFVKNNKGAIMNLSEMQDLLNGLEAFFKIFTYPKEDQITLRVFYDIPFGQAEYRDITYDMGGNYVESI